MEHLIALHQMLLHIDSSLGLRMLVFISELDMYFDIEFSSGDSSDLEEQKSPRGGTMVTRNL
jgi:hypothetical protein